MRFSLRIFSLLTFLGWLFATGHVAAEHHGMSVAGGVHHEMEGGADHHDDAPGHDGDHHGHDLMAFAPGHFAKTAELKALAPVWVPLSGAVVERLLAMVRETEDASWSADGGPPLADERLSGWLLVVQTALPVRGPSLI